MDAISELPDSVKCPYCGAANALDSEFCGACFKKLHIPGEVRAEAKARGVLGAAVSEKPAAPPASRLWGRAALVAGLFVFYLQWLRDDKYFSFIDYVNLAFHEAGHIFLGFLGEFIGSAGGTIFQLLMPAVCLAHLKRRGSNLGWQLCLFWIGQNLLNISIYVRDAIKQELPLVGGGVHDWTYLLTELGLIAHPEGAARSVFLLGSAVIFWSFWLIGRDAAAREPINLGNT